MTSYWPAIIISFTVHGILLLLLILGWELTSEKQIAKPPSVIKAMLVDVKTQAKPTPSQSVSAVKTTKVDDAKARKQQERIKKRAEQQKRAVEKARQLKRAKEKAKKEQQKKQREAALKKQQAAQKKQEQARLQAQRDKQRLAESLAKELAAERQAELLQSKHDKTNN